MRRHLTYANVVSSLCLFILLGGSAVAAGTLLPKNSVGTKQIRKHAVTKAKLAPKLVKALKGQKGATGATGPQGLQGVQGERGPQGETGPAGPTFGDAASAPSTYGHPACTPMTPVTKTITLDHRGLLFALSQGQFYANGGSGSNQTANQLVLHKAGDTTTLASTPQEFVYTHWPEAAGGPFTSGGIMTDSSGSPYVADPGTYVLELQVEAFGTCGATNLGIVDPGLSVVQLGG
jgi:hypothetical protein